MKSSIRNLFVYLFAYSGVAFVYRKWVGRHGPLVRVVAFHDVDDAVWFEHIIQSLKHDFTIITPEAFETSSVSKEQISIVISFDDGYASWVETCLPILERYGIKALFFINSGLLDVGANEYAAQKYVSQNLRLSPKRTLTWEGAKVLHYAGHTIGGHTVHHTSLRGAGEEVIRAEVQEERQHIEQRLGIIPKHFAYPFGAARDYSEETEKLIHEFGYEYVYIAEPGFVVKGEKHIPRTLIEKHQSYKCLHRWVLGSYDIFTHLKRSFMSLKKSSISL